MVPDKHFTRHPPLSYVEPIDEALLKRESHKITLFTGVPRQSWYWVIAAILISLLFHVLSLIELPKYERNPLLPAPQTKKEEVKVNIVHKKVDAQKRPNEPQKKILETPLAETKAPTAPSRLGAQDHMTEKETKVSQNLPRPKAADPGQAGNATKTQKEAHAQPRPAEEQKEEAKPKSMTMTPHKSQLAEEKRQDKLQSITAKDGTVVVPQKEKMTPRNNYEKLMPTSKEMTSQVAAGYQDYIDDEVATGPKIDMNTTNFRWIGYFTNMRKAIEMVWVYPSEAVRRGLQGETLVEFTIKRDGTLARVKVVQSSGYKVLDDAIVEALRLAAPYAPLPSGFKEDRLTVTGSFRYVLTAYAGGP